MSALLNIVEQLQATHAEIRHAERHLTQHAESAGVRISINSLYQRQTRLQSEFDAIAAERQIDVCKYKLIPKSSEDYSVAAVSKILLDFQELVTVLFDGIRRPKRRQKNRMRVGKLAKEESSFNFSYTFAGSLGFVFSVRNEPLTVPSFLDDAIQRAFELVNINQSAEVEIFVAEYGSAPVRKAYEWAEDHIESEISVDVRWQRDGKDRAVLVMQPEQFSQFRSLVDQIGEEVTTELVDNGVLLGADVKPNKFHILLDNGEEVRGRFSSNLKWPDSITINKRYNFSIHRRTIIKAATDRDEEVNELVAVAEIS